MAGSRLKSRPGRKSGLNRLLIALIVILLTLIAAMGTVLLIRHAQSEPEEEETPETVHIGGQDVVINQELNRSDLEEAHFTSDDTGTITYSGSALYGVDVSAHQGEIDWSAAAGDGIEFAILRIGSRGYSAGAIRADACFEQNYTGAQENGILVGAYFFSQAVSVEEAVEEAEQVLSWLDGRALDGPVVYDWETIEDDVARTDEVPGETVTACARAFCDTISAGGYTPMLYCNGMLGYLSYDLTELQDIGVWYAEYGDYPSYAYAMELWQYTNSGSVSGIEGNADRDIWFRS